MLKQNDIIEYTAEHYSNAETVGQVDDYSVFVPQMIVGEVASVKVNYVKRSVAYGDVVNVIKPSALRTKAECAHFGKCGGCSLMHMCYSEQLYFKRNKVVNNLRKIGGLNCEVRNCVPSPKQLGYRNKLSLPVRGRVGAAVAGMFEKGTHKVVSTIDCMLGGEWSALLVDAFIKYINAEQIAPYNEQDFTGEVRHLVARYIDEQLLVTIVSNGEFKRDLKPLIARLSKLFKRFGLFVNVNTYKNNVIMGKEMRHIYGLKYIEGEHLGVKFRLQPDSFFQVNDGVKDAIYSKVRELLDLSQTEVLIDCFSGVGVLTNVLASDEFDVYGIEIEPSAVQDANELAKLNSRRITNICGDVTKELPSLVDKLKGKAITMVVDPPRKGLSETICNTILSAKIDNLVYISCDSATLARDLAILSQAYNITYIEPYDMFPQTDHIETLICLKRK